MLLIAGSDSDGYLRKVNDWISYYHLSDRVIVAGFLSGPEKADALAGSDLFVLPSMNENFGIAMVESLAAGLPVVISKNVYLWKEIIEGGGGWACDCSREALFVMIAEITRQKGFAEKRKLAKLTAEKFTPSRLKSDYRHLYNSFVKSKIGD